MAQSTHTYKQGHTASTLATHLLRTAEVDGGFLLPHIQKIHHILDIGCGPGTITTGFAKYASEGRIVGVDFSEGVLEKARALASEAKIPTEGPGSVVFQYGDVLKTLPFDDETFDIVYCSQVFGHLPPPDQPLQALAEIRRVLKKGGILATRDGVAQHFYPSSLNLDKLWGENAYRVYMGEAYGKYTPTNQQMPALLRRRGFDVDEKVEVSGAASMLTGREARVWLANRGAGQLKKGEPFYQSWLDAGISEDEIGETLKAVNKWADTEDAWFSSTQVQILAWK
ncbi:hypothetical protein M409DRAFT_36923 [Zasmidium cellare ATCC 36951]|uniref:Methyltransferase type 11 domain-containing protein n=1 Tax=Zasmidium cellare ATCC 36951 TaxID=1080233 RepID=A0A6A6CGH7_ZASCE|nr:uncharacterized protein M409DRAFT_36923 [Zasmidium cellare ATCC 36951]KAF2165290.1 hypothetical protein M409DRAFT_36923 [Zasmidium cellare ATCC 36951]